MKDTIVRQGQVKAKLWLPKEEIEESALQQIYSITEHRRLFRWAAIMPDVHTGIGATIGSVIPVEDAIIPCAVGSDIGCGICGISTGINVSEIDERELKNIQTKIISRIPLGYNIRNGQDDEVNRFATETILQDVAYYKDFSKRSIPASLGTLGGWKNIEPVLIILAETLLQKWLMTKPQCKLIPIELCCQFVFVLK